MDKRLETGLESAMGLIDRVSQLIAVGNTRLAPEAVEAEARWLLRSESPWRAEESVGPVVSSVLGLGPIQPLLDDPETTDILANGPEEVWVDRGGDLELTGVRFSSKEELIAMVERAIAPLGLRIDRSVPMVDARLQDGSRLHAILPPASVDFPLVAIRRFTQRIQSLDDLVSVGSATEEEVSVLSDTVHERRTIVISGGTGAGKTTLLNLLAAIIPASERIVTIEDAAELALRGHVIRLEARPPNAEGAGEITIRSLLRSALRLRPDRIIVGEVRGARCEAPRPWTSCLP